MSQQKMGQVDFDDRPVALRKRSKSGPKPAAIVSSVIVVAALAVLGVWSLQDKPVTLRLASVEPQSVNDLETLSVTLKATAEGLKDGEWTYEILSGPPGAKIGASSGVFTWIPNEVQGPGEYTVTVAVRAKNNKQAIDKLFRTFENFPDFTWTVFDDLVQYQKQPKQRFMFYERLVHLYEEAERPDLSCEARLKLSDYLLKEGHSDEVIEGLAFTIKKFPDEGRYVPKLLDKLEKVCEGTKGADQVLLQFYLEFIPLIPQQRGNEPSPYCMRMLERAIAKFNAAGQPQQAQAFAQQLALLQSLKGPGE